MEEQIYEWAAQRGIFKHSDPSKQFLKLVEELGELSVAMQRHHKEGVIDAIGDMQVVLAILARMYGTDKEACLQHAWDQIKNRKGEIKNGVFVKRASG